MLLRISETDDLYPRSTATAWAPIHVERDLFYKRRSSLHHRCRSRAIAVGRVPSRAPGLRTPSGQLLPAPSLNSEPPAFTLLRSQAFPLQTALWQGWFLVHLF